MEELQLTPAERKQILDQRQSAERRRWIVECSWRLATLLASATSAAGSGRLDQPSYGRSVRRAVLPSSRPGQCRSVRI